MNSIFISQKIFYSTIVPIGLVYCLLTPFYVGAQVDLLPKFSASSVWSKLLDERNPINMFIGVPTVFSQLIDHYSREPIGTGSKFVSDTLNKKMRIIGSGSAPLNVKTYNDWFSLTNYRLLERYGMTEIGMALTNPYTETSEKKRIGGIYLVFNDCLKIVFSLGVFRHCWQTLW